MNKSLFKTLMHRIWEGGVHTAKEHLKIRDRPQKRHFWEMSVMKGKESYLPEKIFNKRLNIYQERTYYFYFTFLLHVLH